MTKDISFFSLNTFQKHTPERKKRKKEIEREGEKGKGKQSKGESEECMTQAPKKQFQSLNFSEYTTE